MLIYLPTGAGGCGGASRTTLNNNNNNWMKLII